MFVDICGGIDMIDSTHTSTHFSNFYSTVRHAYIRGTLKDLSFSLQNPARDLWIIVLKFNFCSFLINQQKHILFFVDSQKN